MCLIFKIDINLVVKFSKTTLKGLWIARWTARATLRPFQYLRRCERQNPETENAITDCAVIERVSKFFHPWFLRPHCQSLTVAWNMCAVSRATNEIITFVHAAVWNNKYAACIRCNERKRGGACTEILVTVVRSPPTVNHHAAARRMLAIPRSWIIASTFNHLRVESYHTVSSGAKEPNSRFIFDQHAGRRTKSEERVATDWRKSKSGHCLAELVKTIRCFIELVVAGLLERGESR